MKIAIIGCGNMGKGLAQRLSQSNQLFLYDRDNEKTKLMQHDGLGTSCQKLDDAIHSSDTVILAVKPANLIDAASTMDSELLKGKTIVSILAGTPLAALKELFPSAATVRMMPNLAVIYGEGVMGMCADQDFPVEQQQILIKTFHSLGKIYWLPESKINALTAIAGSGPAFFYAMLEAMTEAGIQMGFSAEDSQNMVHQMLQGSLTLLEKTKEKPGELIRQIASPGGTTIAGLNKLEELKVRDGIIKTFLGAYERANELSRDWKG